MRALRDARDELECDFRETYGLDLGRMGEEYGLAHAARLCWGLRPGARSHAALWGEGAGWSRAELCQAATFDLLAAALWGLGGGKGNRPQTVGPFAQADEAAGMASLSVEDLMGRLGYTTGGERNAD